MFAIYPDKALVRLEFVSKVLLLVVLSMCILNTEERLNSLVRVIALSLGFFAVKAFAFILKSGGGEIVYGPEGSFLESNNLIGLALGMNLPLLSYLVKIEKRTWLRRICQLMFYCSFPAIVFTYSRGAWLGAAAVVALQMLRHRFRFALVPAAAIFGIALFPLLFDVLPKRLATRYEALENYDTESSAQMRLGSWGYCRRVAYASPITGGGFDHYSVQNYMKYSPEYHERWGRYASACHSSWFTVLGEHGFPGFILWVGLIGSVVVSSWRIRSMTAANPDLFWMFELAGALQVSLAAYAVVSTFIDAAYFYMLYYLVAIVVILKERLANTSVAVAFPEAGNVVQRRVLLPVKN